MHSKNSSSCTTDLGLLGSTALSNPVGRTLREFVSLCVKRTQGWLSRSLVFSAGTRGNLKLHTDAHRSCCA